MVGVQGSVVLMVREAPVRLEADVELPVPGGPILLGFVELPRQKREGRPPCSMTPPPQASVTKEVGRSGLYEARLTGGIGVDVLFRKI